MLSRIRCTQTDMPRNVCKSTSNHEKERRADSEISGCQTKSNGPALVEAIIFIY
jgi:hypothetical protein